MIRHALDMLLIFRANSTKPSFRRVALSLVVVAFS